MHKAIILLSLFFGLTLNGQTSSFEFSYDASGNMTQRSLQVILNSRLVAPTQQPKKSSTDTTFNLKVYPNPAQTFVNIEGKLPPNFQQANIIILNSGGQVLKRTTYSGEIKSVDMSSLKSGIYFMEVIYSNKEKTTYRIVIAN